MVMRDDLSTFADIGMLDDLNDDIQSDTTFDAKKYYSTSYETGNIGVINLPFRMRASQL